jgi:hypothetical protein
MAAQLPRARAAVQQRGFQLQRTEHRWFTRGPFPDIRPAGVKQSGWLFHVLVRDSSGALASGWVYMPPAWRPSPEQWRLQLDSSPDSKPSGVGTPLYALCLTAGPAVMLLVVIAIRQLHG